MGTITRTENQQSVMIRFLYIYQDGKMGISCDPPTEIDLGHIRTGWLRVVRIGAHLHQNAGGDHPEPNYKQIDGDRNERDLKYAVKDQRSETHYHYIPENQ